MSSLTPAEETDLRWLERVVEAGMTTAVAAGQALLEIHRRRLYREGGRTWETYCRQRWDMSRQHAERLIEFAGVMADLGYDAGAEQTAPRGAVGPPPGEYVARPLGQLDDPQQRRDAWDLAAAEAFPLQPTSAHVGDSVARILAGLPPEEQLRLVQEHERQLQKDAAVHAGPDARSRRLARGLRALGTARRAFGLLGEEAANVVDLLDQILVQWAGKDLPPPEA